MKVRSRVWRFGKQTPVDNQLMVRYKNLSGNSGVVAYETGHDSIAVEFEDGAIYRYTYRSAGRLTMEKMKSLAEAGRGLSTFIARHVRKAYAAKLR